MVPSPIDRLTTSSRSPGVRTGIGTYINYLLATGILAAAAVSASLARGGRKATAPSPAPAAPAPAIASTDDDAPAPEDAT